MVDRAIEQRNKDRRLLRPSPDRLVVLDRSAAPRNPAQLRADGGNAFARGEKDAEEGGIEVRTGF